jgi:hypothetical protein
LPSRANSLNFYIFYAYSRTEGDFSLTKEDRVVKATTPVKKKIAIPL